jgi:hypothetical protein
VIDGEVAIIGSNTNPMRRLLTVRRMRSPFRTRPSGPPEAQSGGSTIAPKAVPLIRIGAPRSYAFFIEVIPEGASTKGGSCPDGTLEIGFRDADQRNIARESVHAAIP